VHVSEPADRSVWDPHEVVKTGDVVKVRVREVDVARKRIGLTVRSGAIDRTGASGNDRASGQSFGPRTNAQPSATRLNKIPDLRRSASARRSEHSASRQRDLHAFITYGAIAWLLPILHHQQTRHQLTTNWFVVAPAASHPTWS
jgi:transcriptional accessory protein Tex/SPT6